MQKRDHRREQQLARRAARDEDRHRKHRKKARAERKRGSYRIRQGIKFTLHILDPHCTYCHCRLSLVESTLDHMQPISRGGTNDPSNIALACLRCNGLKSNMTVSEFKEYLENR